MSRKQSAKQDLLGVAGDLHDSLSAFLNDAFTRLTPDRIELRTLFGKGCAKVGPLVTIYSKLPLDARKDLPSKLLQAAQRDCRSLRYAQKYGVLVFDSSRASDACARFILPLRPRV